MKISICKNKKGNPNLFLKAGELKSCLEYYVIHVVEFDARPDEHCFYYDGFGCRNINLSKKRGPEPVYIL